LKDKRSRDYKNIKAFQIADELVLEIYKITKDLPKDEVCYMR